MLSSYGFSCDTQLADGFYQKALNSENIDKKIEFLGKSLDECYLKDIDTYKLILQAENSENKKDKIYFYKKALSNNENFYNKSIKEALSELTNIKNAETITRSLMPKDTQTRGVRVRKRVELNINFEQNSAKLTDNGKLQAKEVAKAVDTLIDRFSNGEFEFAGFTNTDGTAEHNLNLSKRRVESVKRYVLSNSNIDKNQIIAKGYGEKKPICEGKVSKVNGEYSCKNEDKIKSRRVEIIFELKDK